MSNFEPPESAYIYDLFGVEIYAGEEYWEGDEGIFADPLDDNYDSRNNIICRRTRRAGLGKNLLRVFHRWRVVRLDREASPELEAEVLDVGVEREEKAREERKQKLR